MVAAAPAGTLVDAPARYTTSLGEVCRGRQRVRGDSAAMPRSGAEGCRRSSHAYADDAHPSGSRTGASRLAASFTESGAGLTRVAVCVRSVIRARALRYFSGRQSPSLPATGSPVSGSTSRYSPVRGLISCHVSLFARGSGSYSNRVSGSYQTLPLTSLRALARRRHSCPAANGGLGTG